MDVQGSADMINSPSILFLHPLKRSLSHIRKNTCMLWQWENQIYTSLKPKMIKTPEANRYKSLWNLVLRWTQVKVISYKAIKFGELTLICQANKSVLDITFKFFQFSVFQIAAMHSSSNWKQRNGMHFN
jgi:hypothetical protein